MEFRKFGRTDLKVSVFSLGTMRCLSSPDNMLRTIQHALQHGINHIETAQGYGLSEQYVGEALAKLNVSHPVFLTTKITPKPSAGLMAQAIEASLNQLQVHSIDCLALHGINTPEHLNWVLDAEGCMAAVRDAIAKGRIRSIGFSTHGSLDLILDVIRSNQFDFVNLHYNYFFQRNWPAIVLAHANNMGIFIISPADKGGRLYQPSARLKDLCKPFHPLQLAYRFLLSQAEITTLSVGPASPDELDWPLETQNQIHPLTEDERSVFNRLETHEHQQLGQDRCAQCYACLPCPEEIHIPEVLRLRNLSVAFEMQEFAQYRYQMFERAGHWFPGRLGNHCTDCGDCLPRCPSQLAIADLVHETHQRLSGRERPRLWDGR